MTSGDQDLNYNVRDIICFLKCLEPVRPGNPDIAHGDPSLDGLGVVSFIFT